jgi:hypothetical protein
VEEEYRLYARFSITLMGFTPIKKEKKKKEAPFPSLLVQEKD